MIVPLNPHLRNGGKCVILGVGKIDKRHIAKIRLAVLDEWDSDSIANFLIERVVGRRHVGAGIVADQILRNLVKLVCGNFRIEPCQRLAQNNGQYTLFFAGTTRAIGQYFHLFRRRVAMDHLITELRRFQHLENRLLDIVFGNKGLHSAYAVLSRPGFFEMSSSKSPNKYCALCPNSPRESSSRHLPVGDI